MTITKSENHRGNRNMKPYLFIKMKQLDYPYKLEI